MNSTKQITDTSPEALAVQLECLRKMSPRKRIAQMLAMSSRLKRMAFAAIRRRHPDWVDNDLRLFFIELTYGKTLSEAMRNCELGATKMSDTDDLVDALSPVVAALEVLGVRHFVGGSVASSFHGATRSTMDVDVVCELREDHVSSFVKVFQRDYYINEQAVREAVRRKSCFNLIHLPTSFKVDLFVSRGRPFDQEAMRRASVQVLGDRHQVVVPVATAEDSIISKLEWYRMTNETSQRQWDDVSKLVKLLGDSADVEYLNRSAESVGVADLLARLLDQT